MNYQTELQAISALLPMVVPLMQGLPIANAATSLLPELAAGGVKDLAGPTQVLAGIMARLRGADQGALVALPDPLKTLAQQVLSQQQQRVPDWARALLTGALSGQLIQVADLIRLLPVLAPELNVQQNVLHG